jgi:hypothetical protein
MGVGSRFPQWRLSDVNRDFELCPTYPRVLCVPSKISDAVLFHAAKFRSRGRLPALSFVYARNGTTITRSSQPLVGIKAKRSIQDEKLIEAVFESHLPPVPPPNSAEQYLPKTSGAPPVAAFLSSDTPSSTASPVERVIPINKNVIIDARPLGNAMANRAMVCFCIFFGSCSLDPWRLLFLIVITGGRDGEFRELS